MIAADMGKQVNRKVELLAPGGDADSVKAAICAGADAVYCGTGSFNARKRATNLSLQEIEQLAQIAKQRDCRLYLTLNTLVFDHEIAQVLTLLEKVYQLGIRVIIVQDLGLLHILKTYLPEFEVHASTQLTTHNEGQISFLNRFGVSQVNLSRELSSEEISLLCLSAHQKNIKIEVFVHGAFCISFSGQCYMSSDLCGKSGNRGECVQPCRRQYSLSNRNKNVRAVFNLKDNFLFPEADVLYNTGADSFKIEGRIKKFSYVYNVTSAWREQIDALEADKKIRREDKRLETVFNRKFTAGYLKGRIEKDMFIDSSRDQSLKFVGNVQRYWADKKTLTFQSKSELCANTEILIYTPDFTFICKGFLTKKISPVEYQFNIEHKLMGKISKGYQVFTQEFSETADKIRSIIDRVKWVKEPLKISVSGTLGSKLKVVFTSPKESLTLFSHMPITEASNRPLNREVLFSQFSRLGTTPFVLDNIEFSNLSPNCFIPQKELNRLRCEAVEKLSHNFIDPSHFNIPTVSRSASHKRKIKKAYFAENIDSISSETSCDAHVLILPNCIQEISKTADLINRNKQITPFFSSILIGKDFSNALELLKRLDGRTIMTDNTGIADSASAFGINWIAGPGFNIVNSYAVEALTQIDGFCGLFLSCEFTKKERGSVQIPPQVDLWQSINLPKTVITTRQCLIKNISGCKKKRCDKDCLKECNRSETVISSQGKRYFIVKRPGFYTVVTS
ncbi:Peptidase, U32 family [Chitinispirillum alkaliphilum]|nr:Peptidase, U32 family [Chitinispirillum alkaliphilum]